MRVGTSTSGLDETRDRLRANGPRKARVHAMPGARVHEMVTEWPEELAYGAEQNANQAFGAWLLGYTVMSSELETGGSCRPGLYPANTFSTVNCSQPRKFSRFLPSCDEWYFRPHTAWDPYLRLLGSPLKRFGP